MAGDGLIRPLNAPPAQPLGIGVQPGVTNGTFLGRLVLVFGPSGTVSGVFVYKPGTTPGPGNTPIAALTASPTDPFGNTIRPGDAPASGTIISIGSPPPGGTPSFVQLGQATLFLGTGDPAEATPGEVLNQITDVGGGVHVLSSTFRAPRVTGENANAFASVVLSSPPSDLSTGPGTSMVCSDGTTTAALNVTPTGISAGNVPFSATAGTNAKPSLVTSDSWQTIAIFQNGWTANGTCRCRYLPNGLVFVQADVTPGTLANGTNMFQLPAVSIYNPAALTPLPAVVAAGAAALANSPFVNITTSRVFQAQNFPAGTTRVIVNGVYPSGSQLP